MDWLLKILPRRTYKSGTGIQWCLWRWSDAQEPYLTRLFVFKTPWLALCLNNIKQADVGYPHDHTSAFLSIFLTGWYTERRLIKIPIDRQGRYGTELVARYFVIKRRWWNYMRACDWDAHRILDVSPGGMWSICIMGPKVREWNYHTPDGLVHWADFKKQQS